MSTKNNNSLVNTAIFDMDDVDYLVKNFTSDKLRQEVLSANAALQFDDSGYWQQYAELAECALKIKRQEEAAARAARPVPSYHGQISAEDIKSRLDIVNLIEQYTELRKSGQRFSGRCPIHKDKSPSLMVYPDSQSFYCFGCQAHGDIFDFIKAIERCDFKQAVAILGGR